MIPGRVILMLIVHSEVHCRSDAVGEAGARYEIAVVLVEVVALALLKFHFLQVCSYRVPSMVPIFPKFPFHSA